ncbi:MAG: hypothetical protein ACI88A_003719 [Paraglaciecola sp.]|jgi:hypothetical protein
MKKTIFLLASLAAIPGIGQATVIELSATVTDSKNSDRSWSDNILRTYYKDNIGYLDGFIKFDLSGIDNNSVINSITLTTFNKNNSTNDPQIRLYHVNNDTWARGSSYPGLNESVSDIHSGFTVADGAAHDWALDVSTFDWSADLLDDSLSLGMRNEKTSYSYAYWYGNDNSQFAPTLTIDYSSESVPEPSMIVLIGLGLAGVGFSRKKK